MFFLQYNYCFRHSFTINQIKHLLRIQLLSTDYFVFTAVAADVWMMLKLQLSDNPVTFLFLKTFQRDRLQTDLLF